MILLIINLKNKGNLATRRNGEFVGQNNINVKMANGSNVN